MVSQIYIDAKACENILAELLINWLKGNKVIKYRRMGTVKGNAAFGTIVVLLTFVDDMV